MRTQIFILSFLLWSLESIAQPVKPTTEEEYNYGTIGYKIQLQTKLPMKQGYSISDLGIYEEPNRMVSFKGLLRDGDSMPCAVIMIYTKDKNPPEYFCLPTSNAPESIWSRYYQSLNVISDNQIEQLKFMSYGLSKTLMKVTGHPAKQ